MFFFFFKQKTAYEMRISDWSSDVCSSDLFPVDDAVDEIDRVLVGRKRHQDTAIARGVAARADEFGLEADRRAIGDDLKIMIGEPRQQRAARHLGDARSEEHTSELQSLMPISYAVFCSKQQNQPSHNHHCRQYTQDKTSIT